MRANVVVIGGGISGLAAAHRLVERLGPGSVTLIERASRLGGKILTEHAGGFVLEGGPDCFLASKPAGVELCERLGLTSRLIETNPAQRRSFIKRGGRLHPLPDGVSGLVPSRIAPLLTTGILSLRGRARAALEPFVPRVRGDADESVAAFVRRRFGAEAWDWLVEPLLSGIYAGDGDALSLRATFPQLREMERRHGSVLRAMLAARLTRARASDAARRGFVTLQGGLRELVDALVERIGRERIVHGTPVTSVSRAQTGYRITMAEGAALTAAALVIATPADETAALLEPLDHGLAGDLRQIPFVSTATVSVAFPRSSAPHPLRGYGYVAPRAEGGSVVACTWTSSKFPARAPTDAVLLRFFIGRSGAEAPIAATAEAFLAIVREELRQVHGVTAQPLLTRVARWPRAMPQYTLGHQERVARVFERLRRHEGLFLAGASYRGVGIPDCIASGWSAAAGAAAYLGAS